MEEESKEQVNMTVQINPDLDLSIFDPIQNQNLQDKITSWHDLPKIDDIFNLSETNEKIEDSKEEMKEP